MNTTHPEFLRNLLYVNFSFLIFFIVVWVLQIAMWVLYIQRKLRINKQTLSLTNYQQQPNDCIVKNLEVEEWKLKLMKIISICEIIALTLGGMTICVHRIILLYRNILPVEIVLTYIHDFLYLICLHQVWLALSVLNSLVKYLRGVCDWHMHKPDCIKRNLFKVKLITAILIPAAGIWIFAVPLGVFLTLCIIYQYIKHIVYSKQLYDALKRVAKDHSLKQTTEGRAVYKIKQKEHKRYGIFATLIIIGTFFWIAPSGLSIFQVAIHQLQFVSKWTGFHIELLDLVPMFKIYFITLKDVLLLLGGCFLFPVHICFVFSHFKLVSFNQLCIRKRKRPTELYCPLVE